MLKLLALCLLISGCAKPSSESSLGGSVGPQGPAGASAPPTSYTPVGFVDPCGDAPSIIDEVFIKMSNGQLLASFSDNYNGDNTRLVVLPPGTYTTTDGESCTFTVNSNGELTYESHHN